MLTLYNPSSLINYNIRVYGDDCINVNLERKMPFSFSVR